MVSARVGAVCESEKEGEAGAKPHHNERLHCVTHNFNTFRDMRHEFVCLTEAEATLHSHIQYLHHLYHTFTVLLCVEH